MTRPERKLFGTDGVRGVAGELITAELSAALGRAATATLEVERPQVLIIRDTRESGPMISAALAAGVAEAGGDALMGGVLPTPAASVLVRRLGLDLAAVVSASHNPWADNGIKFLGSDGAKLDDDVEARIEAALTDSTADGGPIGRVRDLHGGLDDYVRELRTAFELDLDGTTIALDCANGATYQAAPQVFERLGARVEAIGLEPNGRNINEGCGSTHPEHLAEIVRKGAADVGFAFDGDGDRLIAVDGTGAVRDGDELIALAARHLADAGGLAGGVAVTVMTNYGFNRTMRENGIEVAQTDVGDRYVLAEMNRRGWNLGGEQSGHIIWTDFAPTGDGIAAALLTMRALGGRALADVEPFERLAQRLENVEVADRRAIPGAAALWAAVEEANGKLDGRGRVLVRASGTEPLLRIMVEAPDAEECDRVVDSLAAIARETLA